MRRIPHRIAAVVAAVAAVVALSALTGCDLMGGGAPRLNATAATGFTVGGAQDIGAARSLIEAGSIPEAGLITYEGLFSEHDIPAPQGGCEQLLCLQPGVAVYRPAASDTDRVLIQVSMSSNIDAATFRHGPLQTVIVVDRSGSMTGTADTVGTSKMDAVKNALTQAVGMLSQDDELCLISFNDEYRVDLDLAPLTGTHRTEAARQIARWSAGGSTDIETPLSHAFEILAEAPDREGYAKRVLLFTDALPNTGRTDQYEFVALAQLYAAQGIGLTAFGVGLDFGAELARNISEMRGGNYVFLRDAGEIERMLSDDLEFLLSPVAYDFDLTVEPGQGMRLTNVYGMPGGIEDEFSMSAKTLFLSRRTGAVAVELTPGSGAVSTSEPLAEMELTYVPIGQTGRVAQTLRPVADNLQQVTDNMQASGPGVQKLAALVDMAKQMQRALVAWHGGEQDESMEILQGLEAQLRSAGELLNDDPLKREADLAATLRGNMQAARAAEGERF